MSTMIRPVIKNKCIIAAFTEMLEGRSNEISQFHDFTVYKKRRGRVSCRAWKPINLVELQQAFAAYSAAQW